MRLAIVDLGYGNIGSIRVAFERLGESPRMASSPEQIAAADRLVFPGVGAAGFAMRRLLDRGIDGALRDYDRPLLGICLGMQLLFERTEEDETEGVGLIPGTVRAIPPAPGLPVPHMGWSRLEVSDEHAGLRDGDYVYFAHSFACGPDAPSIALADYGGPIPAAVRQGNLVGCQFHPERSGPAGARFLQAFLQS